MTANPTRRRVLELTGAGATASLAGCSSLMGENGAELEADAEPDIDASEGVTALVEPPEEELMEAQQEVMEDVEGEEPSQEELEEMQAQSQEVILSYAVEFEADHADDDDISIEAGVGEQGTFLLSGSGDRLIELLQAGEITGLMPGEEYEMMLQELGMAEGEPAPDPDPDPDETDDDSSADADDDEDADAESDTDDETESDSDSSDDDDDSTTDDADE